jgi:hypothetical protein
MRTALGYLVRPKTTTLAAEALDIFGQAFGQLGTPSRCPTNVPVRAASVAPFRKLFDLFAGQEKSRCNGETLTIAGNSHDNWGYDFGCPKALFQ